MIDYRLSDVRYNGAPWYCTICGQQKLFKQAWCCIMSSIDSRRSRVLPMKLIGIYLEAWR